MLSAWSRIETSFDPDEETANFGTRHAIEASGKIFDVFTHATISPQGPVVKDPWLISRSRKHPDKLAVAIDSYLHVFNHDLQEDCFSVDFKSIIDVLEWTPNVNFIVCGLRSGQIQLVHIPTKMPLPPIGITEQSEVVPTLIGLTAFGESANANFTIFSSSGKVVEFSTKESLGINLSTLHSAIVDGDFPLLKSLQEDLQINEALLEEYNPFAMNVIASPGVEDSFGLDNTFVLLLAPKKVFKHTSFALDNEGVLHIICSKTMLSISKWSGEKVVDLALIEDENNLKIIMVADRMNKEGELKKVLQIREYPRFNSLYELEVSSYCRLLDVAMDQETPLFVEGSYTSENVENQDLNNSGPHIRSRCVQMLRIRGICDGNPEARLMRLLARKKFDEAEKFAALNRLSMEEIHQSKSIWLMEKLSAFARRQSEYSYEDLYAQLEETLKKVADIEFMVRCCLNVTLTDLKLTRKLLMLARSVIQNNIGHELEQSLMVSVSKALHRLDSYIFVSNDLTCHQPDVEEWLQFSRTDMQQECMKLLSLGQFSGALILWNRHQSEFANDVNNILLMLDSISNASNFGPSQANGLAFLTKFMADSLMLANSLNELPGILEALSKWIIIATKSLEAKNRSIWPDSGITFAQTLLDGLYSTATSDDEIGVIGRGLTQVQLSMLFQEQKLSNSTSFNRLLQLIDTLRDLKTVHKEYKLRVQLDDFDASNKVSVATLLLDWCTSHKEVEALVKCFLVDFLKKHGYNPSQVFAQYVQGLVQKTDFCWYSNPNDSAPWEMTVAVLIEAVECISTKLDLILAALRQAPAPWSSTIRELKERGLALQHPMTALITEQENLVIVKQMVAKYKAGKVYQRKGRSAVRLLKKMFSMSLSPETYQDAIKVAQVMPGVDMKDARLAYIEKLVSENCYHEAVGIVKDIKNPEESYNIAEQILVHAEVEMVNCSSYLESYILFLGCLLIYFKSLANTSSCLKNLETRYLGLKNQFTLQSQYKIRGNVDESGINSFIDECYLNGMDSKTIILKLLKIAELANCQKSELLLYFVKKLVQLGLVEELPIVLPLCEGILDIMEVIQSEGINLSPSLVTQLKAKSSHCVENSMDDSKMEALITNSSWATLMNDLQFQSYDKNVFGTCEEEQDDFIAEVAAFRKKLEAHCFKDRGLPLEQSLTEEALKLMSLSHSYPLVHADESILDQTKFGAENVSEEAKLKSSCNCSEYLDIITLNLSSLCSSLMGAKQHFLAFKVLKLLEWPLACHEQPSDVINALHESLTNEILAKALNELTPDLPFALSFLSGQCKAKLGLRVLCQQKNSKVGVNNQKLSNLARLGSRYCSRLLLKKEKAQFMALLVNAIWGKKLALNGLELAGMLEGSPNHKNIFNDFITKFMGEATVIEDLKQYVKAFSPFTLSSAMSLFIRMAMTSPTLNPNFVDGKLVITTKLFATVTEQVQKALGELEPDEKLDILNSLAIEEISPYNYEALEFVFANMVEDETNDKCLQMLAYLKTYRRIGVPCESEIDHWADSKTAPFPAQVASIRLSFHRLMREMNNPKNMFKLLMNDEFVLESYDQWLSAPKVFRLNQDYVRVQAVQNSVSKLISPINNQSMQMLLWHPDPILPSDVFDSVFQCLEGVKDLLKAISTAHSVAAKLPNGNDKLLVARRILAMAQKWHDHAQDVSSANSLAFTKKLALNLEIENILQRHRLNHNQAYLELVNQKNFAGLIMTLYDDDSILERRKSKFAQSKQWPDINAAAKEIAKVTHDVCLVDLTGIKYQLLDMWLPDKSAITGGADLDETASFDLLSTLKNGDMKKNENEDNYWRSVYILEGFALDNESAEGCECLLEIIFSPDSNRTVLHKLRALKCLLSVFGSQAIVNSFGRSTEELDQRFQGLYLVSKLEALHLPYNYNNSVEALDACDKLALIESILRNSGHLPEGISLVVDLCILHEVFMPALWSKLLSRLLKIGQLSTLKHTLIAMSQAPSLWHLTEFHEGWNKILLEPFAKAAHPPTQESIDECSGALVLLQSCPIAAELDVNFLKQECSRLGMDHFNKILEPLCHKQI